MPGWNRKMQQFPGNGFGFPGRPPGSQYAGCWKFDCESVKSHTGEGDSTADSESVESHTAGADSTADSEPRRRLQPSRQ